MGEPRTYRFSDASRPGLVLGLTARQAVPVIVGVLGLVIGLQSAWPVLLGVAGPTVGFGLAFGRWRGVPLTEVLVPGARLIVRRARGHRRWVRPSLVGDNTGHALPRPLRGLELLEPDDLSLGVIRDRLAGTVTAVVRIHGHGFPLAGPADQDGMLAAWGSALSPFARERCPVSQVTWQEWAHPVTHDTHAAFLETVGVGDRADDPAVADYRELVGEQEPVTVDRDVLVAVTVDQHGLRTPRGDRLAAAVGTLDDEVRRLTSRLEAAGLRVDGPLSALDLSAAARLRSDPGRAAQVTTLTRSLAAASRRGALEWGPMVVEADWRQVRVDGAHHRSYHVSGWPRLPVTGDWLAGLLADTRCVRTVTVVLEPVPMGRAARAADREVMAREADSDLKERKGFRVNARERQRLTDAERREQELAHGHAEFRFVGIVTVTAPSLDQLDDDCAAIEQAAAQCFLDLRPLDARHDVGWVAALPFGRAVARTATS